jgi:hypothetical protein
MRLALESLTRSLTISEKSKSGRVLGGVTKLSLMSTVPVAFVDAIIETRLALKGCKTDDKNPSSI